MRKRILNPIAAMAVVATTLVGCASSNENIDNTTATESISMSQTQAMGGNDAMMDDREVSTTRDVTLPAAPLLLTNTEDIDEMFADAEDTETYDVLALARMSDNLSTFVALAEAAELDLVLQSEGPFTVFAPTNEAFGSLSKSELEDLRNPANKMQLRSILENHVLPSKVNSMQFDNTQRIQSSGGGTIPVTVTTANTVGIGGATIVRPDIEASNGMLHVVDAIIMPTNTGARPGGY